jgi:pheromone shutdown-related protein TraB
MEKIMIESLLSRDDVIEKKIGSRTFYLIGTNHVSLESQELVGNVIQAVQPECICIELDEKRYENMIHKNRWDNLDIVKVFKNKQAGLLFTQILFGAYQKKLSAEYKSQAGGEILRAIQESEELNIPLSLVDRDVNITFKKIWRTMSFIEKCKFPMALIDGMSEYEDFSEEEFMKEMMGKDMLDSLFDNLKQTFPNLHRQMITERDEYLATNIFQSKGEVVVAVIGKAHLAGVCEKLGEKFDLEKLNEVPEKRKIDIAIEYIFPSLLIILLALSFMNGFQNGLSQLTNLLLWNSSLAALFTLLALGHPLAIITAFITAPIGTFSPLLSVGIFTGIVQAVVKKPQVKDFERISEDIFHVKAYYTNKALKVFFIFFMSSIGGLLGNIIASLDIIKNL